MRQDPDSPCPHDQRAGIVTSGGGVGEPHAAVNVCGRPSCVGRAIEWATRITWMPARYVGDWVQPNFDQLEMFADGRSLPNS